MRLDNCNVEQISGENYLLQCIFDSDDKIKLSKEDIKKLYNMISDKDDWEERITKKVCQPFLITSEEVLRLMRDKKAEINLPNDTGFRLIIDDEQEE